MTDKNSKDATDSEPLWTVDEIAQYLRLKAETVRMMARTNKIPAMKVGKAWRFRSSEIKQLLGTIRQSTDEKT